MKKQAKLNKKLKRMNQVKDACNKRAKEKGKKLNDVHVNHFLYMNQELISKG